MSRVTVSRSPRFEARSLAAPASTKRPGPVVRRPRGPRRRGAIVVLVAFLMVALVSMLAFSTDVGNITVNKTTLKAAADSAALAAAGSITQGDSMDGAQATALAFANLNLPASYGNAVEASDIEFGRWDPTTHTFTAASENAHAVRVTLARTEARKNPVTSFFGNILDQPFAEMQVESIAVGAPRSEESLTNHQVYVTSTKDLSNVVLEFADGSHQKFEGLSSYSGTFQGTGEHAGKEVVGVWVKSGCNTSSDGPGYGERIDNPGTDSVVHGDNSHGGCTPHVTATFQSSGVEFSESGFVGPVRLVL